MIISISRRSDVAAFYTPWLMNRLRAGYALVPRPYQDMVLERVDLRPKAVDALVIISKNPRPLLPYLDELRQLGYPVMVQMTINGYGSHWEPEVPSVEESIETFCAFSQVLGAQWVDWRYDPILLADSINEKWHQQQFAKLCAALHHATTRCIISFVDSYPHLNGLVQLLAPETMRRLAATLAECAAPYDLPLFSCAEALDFSEQGIQPGACLDGERLSQLLGWQIPTTKAKGQRPHCRCVASQDLGSYNTCLHKCRYCYATTSTALAQERYNLHDPTSPLLWGHLTGQETIIQHPTNTNARQLKLF